MTVRALQWNRKMRGGAHSHLMHCSDGAPYVVKFLNNPQHPRVLVAEYLGTKLAALLGLPVPECALVEVTENLIEKTPGLTVSGIGGEDVPCLPGIQFGSKFVGGLLPGMTQDYLPEDLLAKVRNLQDFAGALIFDKWTYNADGRQAVFHKRLLQRRYGAVFVDQGYCFGAGSWEFKDLPLRGVYGRNLPYAKVSGWKSFEPWLSQLKTLDEQAVWEIAQAVPLEWYGGVVYEIEALVEKLMRRRANIADFIDSFRTSSRNPFPGWVSTHALGECGP